VNLLRIATGKQAVLNLPASILSEGTVQKFVAECRRARRSEASTRSALNQARSVFKPSPMYIFKDLKLPERSGFRVQPEFKIALDESFTDFTPAEVEGLTRGAAAVWDARNPVWVVYVLIRTTFDVQGNPVQHRTPRLQAK